VGKQRRTTATESQGQANMAAPQVEEQTQEPKEFNKEEIERLRHLSSTLEKLSSSGNCSLMHSSKLPISHALNASDTSFKDS